MTNRVRWCSLTPFSMRVRTRLSTFFRRTMVALARKSCKLSTRATGESINWLYCQDRQSVRVLWPECKNGHNPFNEDKLVEAEATRGQRSSVVIQCKKLLLFNHAQRALTRLTCVTFTSTAALLHYQNISSFLPHPLKDTRVLPPSLHTQNTHTHRERESERENESDFLSLLSG